MGVRKRRNKSGFSAEYHYEFMHNGKRHCGVCENCTTQAEAKKYEQEKMALIKKLGEQRTVEELVVNFKRELGNSVEILLQDAFASAMKKPRKRNASSRQMTVKRMCWDDFIAFMSAEYPDIKAVDQVEQRHAEEYIHYLRTQGRYNKSVTYSANGKTTAYKIKNTKLSVRTLNLYQQTITEVFALLQHDAGITQNPFASIPKPSGDAETREAFSEAELVTIRDHADAFTLPLFTLAIATALREGDICTLRWSEVDLEHGVITRKMNKTGNTVEIPMMPPLQAYLTQLHEQRQPGEYGEYVLPEHARMYLTNNSGVSYRIKQFLEETCGIATTRKVPGRSRAVSVKDLHSCRHTFCYYAGLYGIPLAIVQSIVGHMTPELTKHYSAHATLEDKREKLKQLPGFLSLAPEPQQQLSENTVTDAKRRELIALIQSLPEDAVTILLETARRLSSNPATDTP